MNVHFNFPRNLRAFFGFLRVATLVIAVLQLMLLVIYPLINLHLPTSSSQPLADVWLRVNSDLTQLVPIGAGAEGIELTGMRGALWFSPERASAALDSLLRWRFFLCEAAGYLFLCLLFELLWQLCGNVERGDVFSERNIRLVRRLGLTLLGYQAVGFMGGLLFARRVSEFCQQHMMAGGVKISGALFPLSLKMILAGILMLLLAEVFRQGLELKKENELTV